MKKFLLEFKEFALRGNVMNLAVGIIVGGAFQGVVTSLTNDILSPIIGLFTQKNFDTLELNILGTSLKYGAFLTTLINFVIMAFIVFLIVKGMNKLIAPPKKPDPRKCPFCMSVLDEKATRCPACTSAVEV